MYNTHWVTLIGLAIRTQNTDSVGIFADWISFTEKEVKPPKKAIAYLRDMVTD